MRHMGGLRKKIPMTFWTMMCAVVAIAGVPPFSGFYSKDAILVAAYEHAPWMYWVGVITAGMTAFYVFRAIFLAFFGEYRGHAHPHESPPVMLAPLAFLAIALSGGGFFNVPKFLEPMFPLARRPENFGPDAHLGGVRAWRHRAGLATCTSPNPACPIRSPRLQRPLQADLQQVFRG